MSEPLPQIQLPFDPKYKKLEKLCTALKDDGLQFVDHAEHVREFKRDTGTPYNIFGLTNLRTHQVSIQDNAIQTPAQARALCHELSHWADKYVYPSFAVDLVSMMLQPYVDFEEYVADLGCGALWQVLFNEQLQISPPLSELKKEGKISFHVDPRHPDCRIWKLPEDYFNPSRYFRSTPDSKTHDMIDNAAVEEVELRLRRLFAAASKGGWTRS